MANWVRTRGYGWEKLHSVESQAYVCGYCGNQVASDRGYLSGATKVCIRICPECNCPTFFPTAGYGDQWPGPLVGRSVANLPKDVERVYGEARASMTVSAFTGTVMLCRKILMHVAVEKGARENQGFLNYVDWLVGEHYAPRGSEGWVDYIRKRGNESNHELVLMTKQDAVGVFNFAEALLRNVYELPGLVPKLPSYQRYATLYLMLVLA